MPPVTRFPLEEEEEVYHLLTCVASPQVKMASDSISILLHVCKLIIFLNFFHCKEYQGKPFSKPKLKPMVFLQYQYPGFVKCC